MSKTVSPWFFSLRERKKSHLRHFLCNYCWWKGLAWNSSPSGPSRGGLKGRQMVLHLLFLPAISASTKFYFSSPINFLRFLLFTEPKIELLLLLWLYYIVAALLFCHLENIKLKQPIISFVGERMHADTSCPGCSQVCPLEASASDHSTLHTIG